MDLSSLNPAQRAAVTAGPGAHLVVAGAGTGKTNTLVHRVAWLLDQGVAPERVVLLTFTRRAAGEMLDRVARIAGSEAHRVRGGTYHAFAHLTLRRYAERLGYPRSFTILDRPDAEQLVGLVRAELGYGGTEKRFARKNTILDVLSRSVNTGASIPEVLAEQAPQYEEDAEAFVRIGARYAERKQQNGVVDYDDLLVLLGRLLVEDEDARRRLSTAAEHVLVDEYQDTNRLQAKISALLASVHGNLMVVGDEAQSIYGFRGAAVQNILDFPKLFPGAGLTVLEENYRSVQGVLDLANGVLASATQGYDKRLRAVVSGGVKPVLVELGDEHDQATYVVREVLRLREEGVPLERQAVLFRSGWHANLVEILLSEANIPFRKYGGLRFTEASHIKDAFALLRLVANPRDALAWFRVLRWFPGVGEGTAGKLSARVAESNPPRLDPAIAKGKRYHPDLVSLARFLDEAGEQVLHVVPVVERAVAWLRERLADLYPEDWVKRGHDLGTLTLLAERYRSLESFLAEVALDPVDKADAEANDLEDEHLVLSTVHSAKGLEWDAVFVLHLADGFFPSGYSLNDAEQLEEERRLFYVAITRARKHLAILRPRYLRQVRGPTLGPGCALLDELTGLDHLVRREHFSATRGNAWTVDPEADELARIARLLGHFGEG